tara:strand:- start:523 stop:735 length:213 start_codon:yes stop_codon:yes gene_type:complete
MKNVLHMMDICNWGFIVILLKDIYNSAPKLIGLWYTGYQMYSQKDIPDVITKIIWKYQVEKTLLNKLNHE